MIFELIFSLLIENYYECENLYMYVYVCCFVCLLHLHAQMVDWDCLKFSTQMDYNLE